ncbi:hypothetical protein D3C76_64320 [compost metagenome]|uniref:Uncharacterized protein n=1 Tax=Paenibacillus rhizolycopersici TaxID=2780073 RepID=A0ABS2HC78_9BACL|nr:MULTISPECIES: hypothetical protein [Paenibacillus]MBM6998448.1 hypothetical protein [Paenibacillus rhizolycopersici]MUG85799.1 hypothetical protein [Paenibacillus timonensis]
MSPVPWQTQEEAEIIKQYVLLPLLLDALERDRRILASASLKLPQVYKGLIGLLQNAATADLTQVRQSMREHGLKVFEERRTNLGIEARYLCRGYTYEFSMLWGLVKAELISRLYTYLGMDVTKEGMFS